MDVNWVSWLAVGLGVMLLLSLVFMQRQQKSKPRARRRQKIKETKTVALVRRRRELSSQLAELAGDQSRSLLEAEARRMRAASSDIAVLEAALARAERMSDRAELGPEPPSR